MERSSGLPGSRARARSEIARLIYGVDRIAGGEILLEGRPTVIRSPRDALARGIAMVPEDRIGQERYFPR